MKVYFLLALAACPGLFAGSTNDAQLNVNSRYTVESIDFSDHKQYRFSSAVIEDMQRLVGEKLNIAALSRLAKQLTNELRARAVTFSIARGSEPAHVRVMFDVDKQD